MVAPPAIPIIKSADPDLVNFPKSAIANGQMAGHMIAFASPSNAMQATLVYPDVRITAIVNSIPKIAENSSALLCEMILGMVMIPRIYPTIIDISVKVVNVLAV